MPPKPPQPAVNDHMNWASGKEVIRPTILSDSRLAASSVESGADCRNMLMCPWSSTGASSFCDSL
jgi:hypothetical protein